MIRRLSAAAARRAGKGVQALGSLAKLASCRLRFPEISFGSSVYIAPSATLRATDGGSIAIGDRVKVMPGAVIVARGGRISIGADSHVGYGAIITAIDQVTIGKFTLIAEYVTVRDQNHGTRLSSEAFARQPLRTAPVHIGDNVWLAAKATVLKGVRIGNSTIVGAGAVVVKDVPSRSLAIGVPARSHERGMDAS